MLTMPTMSAVLSLDWGSVISPEAFDLFSELLFLQQLHWHPPSALLKGVETTTVFSVATSTGVALAVV